MAKREVLIGLATFRRNLDADTPVWGFALLGETVDVHEDDLKRFDGLNQAAPTSAPALPAEAAVNELVEEPPRSGRGSGADAWRDYAEGLGLKVPEGATRDEIVELVDAR